MARTFAVIVVQGNLWDYLPTHHVIVTTNVGWRRDGRNPMGRGVAAEAASRFPDLPRAYGRVCLERQEKLGVVEFVTRERAEQSSLFPPRDDANEGAEGFALVMFPTKPLCVEAPYFSWQGKATLDRIEQSTRQLVAGWSKVPVALPLVGCENGGRTEKEVMPILREFLRGDNFTLVLR